MRLALLALLALSAAAAIPEPEKFTVFEGKTSGYAGYRIPALVRTTASPAHKSPPLPESSPIPTA